jgi:homopolymeric O-antigen transport system ATP-binding protein
MPAIITVENLSKAYRIGLKEKIPDTLVGAVKSRLCDPLRNLRNLRRLDTFSQENDGEDVVWALRDVSFEIQQGEVLGIIGRNGAGKSTLLKILSNITEPTRGRAVIRGRVSSLLEVGTGFHQEMTGRDNVYMNGTILGMTKKEIDRKFDEIVDFSGVERFLDTPIKRYSSGMQVRLAFAVAAHLEPEILIVDEVLAVGDAEFQNKCLGKMQAVASSGRTVIFVSHNMAAVSNLCSRGLILAGGEKACDGPVDDALEQYAQASSFTEERPDLNLDKYRQTWCRPLIKRALIVRPSTQYPAKFHIGGALTVELEFDSNGGPPLRAPVMGLVFHHATKGTVGAINTRMTGFAPSAGKHSRGVLRCTIPKLPFLPGHYYIDLWLGDGATDLDVLMQYLCFEVKESDYYGTGHGPFSHLGMVVLDADWQLTKEWKASNL